MVNGQILVVMGGTSTEKEVSMRSGEAMYNALRERGYDVDKFVLSDGNIEEIIKRNPKCAVLALHGKGGEDGTIQGLLELANIPYTGSGVLGSAIGMNKIVSKKIISYEKIRTAKFISLSSNELFNPEELSKKIISTLGLPVVIKAPSQGSSVGVLIVHREEDIHAAVEKVYAYDKELLIEEYLPGKELTIPVMKKDGKIVTLPLVEIVSENNFYDYESKYTVGLSHHIIPAKVSAETNNEIISMAVSTYKSLNCGGLVRVDFMLDNNQIPYVMEVNTLPGMTGTSLVPDSARAAGITFEELVSDLVEEAVKERSIR